MSADLLRGQRAREGFAKKAATSKGSDSCRGNWQDRYFVLIKHELLYYKKKDDSSPKGMIDLRAARVDPVPEAVTAKPFCIRIAQAKQVFVYIQFTSDEDRDKWVTVLRIGAGYKEGLVVHAEERRDGKDGKVEALPDIPVWNDRTETLLSFPLLLLPTPDSEHPERITLSLTDCHGGVLRLVKGDLLYSTYRGSQINRVEYSPKPELRLVDTAGVHELHTCTILIKLTPNATSLIKYVFFAGALDDARLLTHELRAIARGDLVSCRKAGMQAVLQSGYVEFGDTAVASGWLRRFCCMTDRRLILYKTAASLVPAWVINLTNQVYREGKVGIRIGTSLETCILKFETEALRDLWLTNILTVSGEAANKNLIQIKDFEEAEKAELRAKSDNEKRIKLAEEQAKQKVVDERVAPVKKPQGPEEEKSSAPAPPVEVKFSLPKMEDFGAGEPAFLVALGNGELGQLGNRGLSSTLVPTLVDSLAGKNVRHVSSGREHSACVTESGHVFVWGSGKNFQLGLGERMQESRAPCLNTSLLRFGGMQFVSCGADHTIAVSFTGQVFTWGSGASGALAHGRDLKNQPYPQQVEAFKKKPVCFASAGASHSAFITAENSELFLCGTNNQGCLGLYNCQPGQVVGEPQPCSSLNQIGKVTSVSCSNSFTCAVIAPGRLFSWGANGNGQLGVRDRAERSTPTLVQFPGKQQPLVKQIATGSQHCIALAQLEEPGQSAKNVIYTWGAPICNGFRELQVLPTLIAALSATSDGVSPPALVASSHSSSHSLCVNSANQMFAFGLNEFGELGNGTAGVQALVKVKLNSACKINQIVCGSGFTMALCKGQAPDQLSSKAMPAPAPLGNTAIPADLRVVPTESGPSLDDAAIQIAKLLQLEADRDSNLGAAPKVKIQPGQIEIDGIPKEFIAQQQMQQQQQQMLLQQQQQQQQAAAMAQSQYQASPNVSSPTSEKAPLPPGWKKVKDEKSGKNYFYHTVTKETTWKRPTE